MAIFHEAYTDAIIVLNEKKTREQYARESFKKKYKYEPSKEDPNIGTITDKSGKKYKVDMRKNNTMNIGGVDIKRQTMADLSSNDSQINLDKNFFKLKGSNKGERRDAVLQHEIGHQNLHNMNPENKTVDKKNRNMSVYKNTVKNMVKDQYMGADISKDSPGFSKKENHDIRKQINDGDGMAAKYASSVSKDKEESKQRRADQATAKKFEKQSSHANAEEYEADRFSANRTSSSAVKKGVRNAYKVMRSDKDFKNADDDTKKAFNKAAETDMSQRSKALKDEDMRKAKSFK